MPKRAWTTCGSLLLLTLMTACGMTVSDVRIVTAPIIQYSPEFQEKLADEFQVLQVPCDRIEPVQPCSATRRAIQDYALTRSRQRALAE